MTKLMKETDIWVLSPTEEDLLTAAGYAAVTLPWTFNRMMLNTKVRGQLDRGLNIAKGIVAQEMLRRELARRGVKAEVQRKSYRDDDLFDFVIPTEKGPKKFDIKSVNYYNTYTPFGRSPLSSGHIIANAGYSGPEWAHFFPMLVPHTQIHQDKEAYCFAISSSADFRRDVMNGRTSYAITTYPYGEHLRFFSSSKLCLAREDSGQGFYIELRFATEDLFAANTRPKLKILGEWDGSGKSEVIALKPNQTIGNVGPFSCVSAFQFELKDYQDFRGTIDIRVNRNDLSKPCYDTARRDINVPPPTVLTYGRDDFCNLILPSNYQLYVLGWIGKQDYLEACRKYVGYIWPNDSVDRTRNQLWTQITEDDEQTLRRGGFEDAIRRKPTSKVAAGWLKTSGRGNGACCYYFPNINYGGGVRETNLYVLPQDLTAMEALVAPRR